MKKTSIICVAYDTTRLQRNMTSACLADIQRYTNRDEYELIFIDQIPENEDEGKINRELDTRHHIIDVDQHIVIPHIGLSAAMNLGYKKSSDDCEYIVFIHNDVFVPDDWLKNMRDVLEEGYKVVMPHQGMTTRQFVLDAKKKDLQANDDAGLIMMSKDTFRETGGWDERFKAIYMSAAFRLRFPEKYHTTSRCIITHIGCGTVYADEFTEQEGYRIESPIFNNLRNEKPKNYLC